MTLVLVRPETVRRSIAPFALNGFGTKLALFLITGPSALTICILALNSPKGCGPLPQPATVCPIGYSRTTAIGTLPFLLLARTVTALLTPQLFLGTTAPIAVAFRNANGVTTPNGRKPLLIRFSYVEVRIPLFVPINGMKRYICLPLNGHAHRFSPRKILLTPLRLPRRLLQPPDNTFGFNAILSTRFANLVLVFIPSLCASLNIRIHIREFIIPTILVTNPLLLAETQ